jgi:hypothetical protein
MKNADAPAVKREAEENWATAGGADEDPHAFRAHSIDMLNTAGEIQST